MSYRRTSDGGEISDFMHENLQPSEKSNYVKVQYEDGDEDGGDVAEPVTITEEPTTLPDPSFESLKKTKYKDDGDDIEPQQVKTKTEKNFKVSEQPAEEVPA